MVVHHTPHFVQTFPFPCFFVSYFSGLSVGGCEFSILNTSEAYCGALHACIWISDMSRLAQPL